MSDQKKINFIQRSPHDKNNPFVMINKEMLRDPNLNPRAKGILCYLLSFPDFWKADVEFISKDQNISIDVTYAILKEIVDAGYACREVERESGKFKAWNYYFSEFKMPAQGKQPVCKNQEMAHNECEPVWQKPELVYQELAHISSNNELSKKQQPQTPSIEKDVAVVFSSKENNKIIIELLESVNAPESIVQIALKFPVLQVEEAVLAFKMRFSKGNLENPMGFLRRAIEEGWKSNSNEITLDNHKFFKTLTKYDGAQIGWAKIFVGKDYIEFVSGQTFKRHEIKEPKFEENVKEILKSLGIND